MIDNWEECAICNCGCAAEEGCVCEEEECPECGCGEDPEPID